MGQIINYLPSEANAEPWEKRQESILTIWKCKAISWTLNFIFLEICDGSHVGGKMKNDFYCTLETDFVFMELYLIPAEMNLRSCLFWAWQVWRASGWPLGFTSLGVVRALWPQLPALQQGSSSSAGLGTTNIQSLVPVSRFLVHPHMTMSSQKSRLHRVSNLGRTVDAVQLLTSLDIVFWWSIHFRDLTGNEKERDNPSLLKRQKGKCGKYSSTLPQKYLNVLVIWVIATCSDSSNAKYVTEIPRKTRCPYSFQQWVTS